MTVSNDKDKANYRQVSWSTNEIDKHERFDYFNDAIYKVYANLTATRKTKGDFFAAVDAVVTGNTIVTKARATTHTSTRTKEQVAQSNDSDFTLVINNRRKNPILVRFPEQEIIFDLGQLGVVDNTKSLSVDLPVGDEYSIGSIMLPGDTLERAAKEYNIDRSKLCNARVSDHPVVGPLAVATTRSLINNIAAMNPLEVQLLIDSLVRMIVVANAIYYTGCAVTEETLRPALLLSKIEYIEQNIESVELSAHSVAAQFGIDTKSYPVRKCNQTGKTG